jgi:DNA-binding GntR family transcriptional regulator
MTATKNRSTSPRDKPTTSPRDKPDGRGQGAVRVYEALREDILSLSIPPGELLDEVQIGRRFQLSRSPVREALIRLASEGLVKTLPNKSTMVAPLHLEEFPAYIDSLDLVQRATTRLAAQLRSASDLAEINACQAKFETALKERDALAMIESNRHFHIAISEAAQNRYLKQFHARLLDEGRRFLRLYFRSFDDSLPPEFCDEHVQIIEAIERQDADLAERLAHEHTQQVSNRFLSYLARRRTADIAVAVSA